MKLVRSYTNNHVRTGLRLYPRRFGRHDPILIRNFEDRLDPRRSDEENCLLIQQYRDINYSRMIINPPQRHLLKHMGKYLLL